MGFEWPYTVSTKTKPKSKTPSRLEDPWVEVRFPL